jgi:AcrR family transcriptional regulator
MDDIGALLGVSGPALYRHFDSKPNLLTAVIHGYIEEQNAAWIQHDPDALTAVISASVHNPNGFAVYTLQQRYLPEAPWKAVAADRRDIRDAWDAHMATVGVPRPGADGQLRVTALQGMLLHASLSRRASKKVRISVAQDMGRRILQAPTSASQPSGPSDVITSPLRHVGKRAAILATAEKQFSQRGFARVTLRDIGQDVGLTASGVSRHFPNKQSILAATIDRAGHQVAAAVAASLRLSSTPQQAVREIIRRYCTLVVESSDVFNVNARLLASLDPAGQQAGIQRRRQNVEELASQLCDSVDGMRLSEARIRSGAAFSIANQVVSHEELLYRPALITELTSICTHAIGLGPD